MYNDNINLQTLKKVSHFTPLFQKSAKAFHDLSSSQKSSLNMQGNQKSHFSYIVIDSVDKINQLIFQCKSICPVFIFKNQSFILVKGQNLWDYYRSKKQHQVILTQEQLCVLIKQITQSLIKLSELGYTYRHLKEYSIYRNSPFSYQLLFHPSIKSMLQLAQSNKFYWYDFYLSPQQLKANSYNQYEYTYKDTIFSLGLMLLNVMNPLDFNKDVYSRKRFQIDWEILNSKLKNSKKKYSLKLISLVQNCLKEFPAQRYSLKEVYFEINQIIKQKNDVSLNFHNKISQLIKSKSKSKSKNSSDKSSLKQFDSPQTISKFTHRQSGGSLKKQLFPEKVKKWTEKKSAKKEYQKIVIEEKENHVKFNTPPLFKSQNKSTKHKISFQQQSLDEIDFQRGTFGGDIKQLINNKLKFSQQTQSTFYKNSNVSEQKLNSMNQKEMTQKIDYDEKNILPSFGIGNQLKNDQDKLFRNIKKLQNSPNYKDEQNSFKNLRKLQFDEKYFLNLRNKINQFNQSINIKQKQITLTLKQCQQPLQKLQKIVAPQTPGIFVQGDIYFGNFKNGRRNGLGLELFPEGQYYFGNFKDDLFHGQGFYFWNKHQYFIGIFQNGKKIFGTLKGPKMNYTGEFNGQKKMNGIGKAIYKSGQIYVGLWKNGKKDSIGEITQVLGDKFVGIWEKGRKNGLGQYSSKDFPENGYTVKAQWKNQDVVGNVLIEYSNGNVYQGSLRDFQKHGKGLYTFKNGGYFNGTFYQDQATHGQLMYKNGQKYIGCLKNMKRHGYGQYHYLDGVVKKGNWIQDVRVQKSIVKQSK